MQRYRDTVKTKTTWGMWQFPLHLRLRHESMLANLINPQESFDIELNALRTYAKTGDRYQKLYTLRMSWETGFNSSTGCLYIDRNPQEQLRLQRWVHHTLFPMFPCAVFRIVSRLSRLSISPDRASNTVWNIVDFSCRLTVAPSDIVAVTWSLYMDWPFYCGKMLITQAWIQGAKRRAPYLQKQSCDEMRLSRKILRWCREGVECLRRGPFHQGGRKLRIHGRIQGCMQGVRNPLPAESSFFPAESALFVEECNVQCLSPVARNTYKRGTR
jgi:hypothetical protein